MVKPKTYSDLEAKRQSHGEWFPCCPLNETVWMQPLNLIVPVPLATLHFRSISHSFLSICYLAEVEDKLLDYLVQNTAAHLTESPVRRI